MSRLSGHELQYEGAPYDAKGRPVNTLYGGSAGDGRAKCSCRALSPVLSSANKRKQWHREHKETMRAMQASK